MLSDLEAAAILYIDTVLDIPSSSIKTACDCILMIQNVPAFRGDSLLRLAAAVLFAVFLQLTNGGLSTNTQRLGT